MDQSLLTFVTVAEHRSFTRAAEHLHMTQPAVSQYIRGLEKTVGAKLLDRSNKYVRLNKAGELVYSHAKEILNLYGRMQRLVDDITHTASGPLAIGASYTFGEYILPHIVSRLRRHYPLIKPAITIGNTHEIIQLVLGHQLDAGVIEGDFHHDKLDIRPFADDRMYIVCSPGHRLAGQPQPTIADLSGETWIIREPGSGTREATEAMFATLRFQPEEVMEFGSTQIIKESVEAGLGLSLLSHWAIRKERSLGSINVLPVEGTPVLRKFSLATASTPYFTKAAELFMDILLSNDSMPG